MEFDFDMALEEHFAPMPNLVPAAVVGSVQWDKVQSAVEKLKRRIIPRDELLQQNRNYKETLEEYKKKIRIMTEEHQAMLMEKTNNLKKTFSLEVKIEESKEKIKDLEGNLEKANLSINALNATIQQLEVLVENKDVEILGLHTENKLQEQERTPPKDETKRKLHKAFLKHLQMFADAAEKRDGINSTLKRILKKYEKKEKDLLPQSDGENDSVENQMYTCPSSVDTGRGSSLASSDDELKIEHFPKKPVRTPAECRNAVFSPCAMPETIPQKSTCDVATSPTKVHYKNASTSPIRSVNKKYTDSDSEDEIYKLTRKMRTNVVPTSPMPFEPQDRICPCGKECKLSNYCRKPVRKVNFKAKKIIKRKNNKIALQTILRSRIDREIKARLEKDLKRNVDEQTTSEISQLAPKESVFFTSEQVAHLLLAMGRAHGINNDPTLETDTVTTLRNTTPPPSQSVSHIIGVETFQNNSTQTPISQEISPNFEIFNVKSVHNFKTKSFRECDTPPEHNTETCNDIFVEKSSRSESASVTPISTLFKTDTDSVHSKTNTNIINTKTTAADNTSIKKEELKKQISRKVTKLEHLRNKLSGKRSTMNQSESPPHIKVNKIKLGSSNECNSTSPQSIKCTTKLQNNPNAYQKAVEVMAQLNHAKEIKTRLVTKKCGISFVRESTEPIKSLTENNCDMTSDEPIKENLQNAADTNFCTKLSDSRKNIISDQQNDSLTKIPNPISAINSNIVTSRGKRKITDTHLFLGKLPRTKLTETSTPNVSTLAQSQIQATSVEESACDLTAHVASRQSLRISLLSNKESIYPSPSIERELSSKMPLSKPMVLTPHDHKQSQDINVGLVSTNSTTNSISPRKPPISYQNFSILDDRLPAPVTPNVPIPAQSRLQASTIKESACDSTANDTASRLSLLLNKETIDPSSLIEQEISPKMPLSKPMVTTPCDLKQTLDIYVSQVSTNSTSNSLSPKKAPISYQNFSIFDDRLSAPVTANVPTSAQSKILDTTVKKSPCDSPANVTTRRKSTRISKLSNKLPKDPSTIEQEAPSNIQSEKKEVPILHDIIEPQVMNGRQVSTSSTSNPQGHKAPISYQDLSIFDDSVESAPVNDYIPPLYSKIPYFLQVIERHARNKGQGRVIKIESVNAKIFEQVTKHISAALKQSPEIAYKTLDKLIERLQKEEYKAVIRAFIEFLCKQVKGELENKPPVPPTSVSEQAMLYCVQRLRQHWHQLPFLDKLMKAIEYKLFRLNAAPPSNYVENLSRFYALLCRITKDIRRLRTFVIDAIYCMTIKSVYVVMSVLDVWYHVLPLSQHQLANDPLVFSIIHLLHYTKSSGSVTDKMRERLYMKFKYEPGKCNQQDLLAKLGIFLRDPQIINNVDSLYVAFLLVGKRYGTDWCDTHLVKGLLLPMLEGQRLSNIKSSSQKPTYPGLEARALAARLLGPLVRPFPVQMRMQSEFVCNRLIEIIYSGVELEVEFGAVQSALVLCTGNTCLESMLANWQPRSTPPPTLHAQMRNLAKHHTLQVWQKKYGFRFEDTNTQDVLK